MKHFYILANPEYFKKAMGWDMKDNDIKYTNDNLVMFVAIQSFHIPNSIDPYHFGYCNADSKSIYETYCMLNNETKNKYCKGEK